MRFLKKKELSSSAELTLWFSSPNAFSHKPQYDVNMLFENKGAIGLNIINVPRSFLVIQLFFVLKHLSPPPPK